MVRQTNINTNVRTEKAEYKCTSLDKNVSKFNASLITLYLVVIGIDN